MIESHVATGRFEPKLGDKEAESHDSALQRTLATSRVRLSAHFVQLLARGCERVHLVDFQEQCLCSTGRTLLVWRHPHIVQKLLERLLQWNACACMYMSRYARGLMTTTRTLCRESGGVNCAVHACAVESGGVVGAFRTLYSVLSTGICFVYRIIEVHTYRLTGCPPLAMF